MVVSTSVFPRSTRAVRVCLTGLTLLLSVSVTGCQQLGLKPVDWGKLSFRSQSPEVEDDEDDFDDELSTKLDIPMVGDYTTVSGLHRVVLEGVGLVVGLNGTGDDPPPSTYREALIDDMARRNVRNIGELIRSPNTTLVVVRAYLPPLARKGDRFDIDVRIPGETNATSLAGGRLLETILSETAVVPGRGVMKGHVVAKAAGPIMVAPDEGNQEDLAGVLKRGRILGGGYSLIDRDMSLYVKTQYRTFRTITMLADRVGGRYYDYNKFGVREPLAEAQTDQRIILRVHPRYVDNYPRYLQVIKNIAYRESPVAQRVRQKRLESDLMVPEKSEVAALQLEAIGESAIPILKSGLKSPYMECRFHAAVALAYLEDSSGVDVLKDAALNERAFRVFAFSAMSIIEDPEANLALRDLMSVQVNNAGEEVDSAETRYGAFRSLWTLDEDDPFIAGVKLNKEYHLHVLETTGAPMIHITQRMRPEVVLFGRDQEFKTPIAVRAGNHILVNSRPGSEGITVSRFSTREEDQTRVVSRRVEDVILACAEMGASYPDIAQMLVQAYRQDNIPGRFEIDALPQAGRVYYRNGQKSRVGRSTLTPNMFQRDGEESEDASSGDDAADEKSSADTASDAFISADPDGGTAGTDSERDGRGVASLSDARSNTTDSFDTDTDSRRWWDPLGLARRK